jgi:hypothetical protein
MRPVSLSRIIILLPRGLALGPLLKHTWGTRSAIVAGTRYTDRAGVEELERLGSRAERDGSTRLNTTSRTRSEKQRFTRASEHRPQRPRRVEPTLTPLGPGSSMEVAARTICLLRPAAHRLCAFLSLWSRLRCRRKHTCGRSHRHLASSPSFCTLPVCRRARQPYAH